MATIRVLSGAFVPGPAQMTKTGLQLLEAVPGGEPKLARVPFSSIRSIVPASGDTRTGTEKAITGSIVGGLTLGVTGAISSAMVNSQPAPVTFTVNLTDGRRFRAQTDSTTYQQLVARQG